MNRTTEVEERFHSHLRRKNKALLSNITLVNSCASSYPESVARHAGKHLAGEVESKNNTGRGSIIATYFLLPITWSTCVEAGSDVHTHIKEINITRVEHGLEVPSNDSRNLAEATPVARLRWRFFFA